MDTSLQGRREFLDMQIALIEDGSFLGFENELKMWRVLRAQVNEEIIKEEGNDGIIIVEMSQERLKAIQSIYSREDIPAYESV